ncbi:MAG: hypothetical protein AAFY16_04995 [Cyanobacteria bacterium J06642_3]
MVILVAYTQESVSFIHVPKYSYSQNLFAAAGDSHFGIWLGITELAMAVRILKRNAFLNQ